VAATSALTRTGEVPDVAEAGDDPERRAMDAEMRAALGTWLRDDLPPELSARLSTWWLSTSSRATVPARLARQLQPYLAPLVPLQDPAA
jgi:hypothetical protein